MDLPHIIRVIIQRNFCSHLFLKDLRCSRGCNSFTFIFILFILQIVSTIVSQKKKKKNLQRCIYQVCNILINLDEH